MSKIPTMTVEEAKTFLGIIDQMEWERRSEYYIAKSLSLRGADDLRQRQALARHILRNELSTQELCFSQYEIPTVV